MNELIRDITIKNGDHKWDVNFFILQFNPYMVQPIHGHYLYIRQTIADKCITKHLKLSTISHNNCFILTVEAVLCLLVDMLI